LPLIDGYGAGLRHSECALKRSEAFLSTDSFEAIEARRNDAQKLADKLQQEIDVLQKVIDKLMR
jgi:hypothetical protein